MTASKNDFRLRDRRGGRSGLSQSLLWLITLRHVVCLTAFLFLLAGCRSRQNVAGPTVEFTKIPPAAQGGRERVDTISGRVTGSRPGQRIVIYAMSGPWWVQPWPDQPFITIQTDSTWSTSSHLGFKYAAMLVDPGYQPPPTMDVAPTVGGSIAALAIVDGVGKPQIAPTVPIKFSGYDWGVRTIASDRGGLNLPYEGDNAWVDPQGALHLRIRKKGNKWSCAEVEMNRSLGYGTYIFTVRDTSHLEPAAVLSLNTFDDWGGEQNYREVDVEMSQWGDGASKDNAQFGIQPFYVPGNVAPFVEPAGKLTHSFHWEPGRVKFVTVRGDSIREGAPVVAEHVFTSGVPSPGHEKMQLLFYVVASDKYPMQKESEVVLEKFEYLP
ncbi:hypothetical protein [Tunturiibacter gelidoferens]|uniref:Uncharacterized protein n=3 Tax=Tunturiibacter TaxID=3154218 RepID=A0A7Y9NP09_9BACT|nr:hypothetical protein [Edaphobacter lichenicola]MBB5337814.1 hypothetical protein [Edaphobacter lichenicola]NYF52899.1 hypothetical protein [Edaphobacter lichenicola]